MIIVRGSLSFWAEFDALSDDDPRRAEVLDIAFALLNDGPVLETTESASWPFGKSWIQGYSINLPDGSGFIGYISVEDPKTGDELIGLLHLIWYD